MVSEIFQKALAISAVVNYYGRKVKFHILKRTKQLLNSEKEICINEGFELPTKATPLILTSTYYFQIMKRSGILIITHISALGPSYFCPSKSSGAAYAGDPHQVERSCPSANVLLKPKSKIGYTSVFTIFSRVPIAITSERI